MALCWTAAERGRASFTITLKLGQCWRTLAALSTSPLLTRAVQVGHASSVSIGLSRSRRIASSRGAADKSLDWRRPHKPKLLDIADTLKRRELFSKETDSAPAIIILDHFWGYLHVEVAAADLRRRMEQFDIFELDPLGGGRILHGHGAMICTTFGRELVKARMVRGRCMASDKFATAYMSLRFSSRPCLPRLLNRSTACIRNTIVEQPCIQGVIWIQRLVLSYTRHMRQQRSAVQVLQSSLPTRQTLFIRLLRVLAFAVFASHMFASISACATEDECL